MTRWNLSVGRQIEIGFSFRSRLTITTGSSSLSRLSLIYLEKERQSRILPLPLIEWDPYHNGLEKNELHLCTNTRSRTELNVYVRIMVDIITEPRSIYRYNS